ncbi:alpha/beta-hydrolase [Coprinopsis marcescibilis]|uniref:Carboxylic ester hydrolase n=1 Tax=Coprinopsis marcescibilis TaxID=230819 RepID=A0A5C3KL16_COPMA|nr:alpha/beta-hydrolase [Coprinopsis marcescibilis]
MSDSLPESKTRTVKRQHNTLKTTFCGAEHPLSEPDTPIHQYLGIKYASIPMRFRQSILYNTYPTVTPASEYGPICPQPRSRCIEELLFGISESDFPPESLKQNEFECLNLNITCPAGLTPTSRLPVMLWIHGGGDKGSGSSWIYDGARIVRKSMSDGKPVIMVTFNFRVGLLGFAASPMIREDNKLAGEEGTGNYGLRDQQRCLEWLQKYIADFGGDPSNITLFGESSGAADIICHLLSRANETNPIFARAIIQSAVFEPTLPDVPSAGWQLSRLMSSLGATSMEKLRSLEVDKLLGLGSSLRAVDDGTFFCDGWKSYLSHSDPSSQHHSRHSHNATRKPQTHFAKDALLRPPPLHRNASSSRSGVRSRSRGTSPLPPVVPHPSRQPVIIGDCSSDSLLWSLPISLWTAAGVVRRIKAICLSVNKAAALLRSYDISSYTPADEIADRILELVNDARISWPTECLAEKCKFDRQGHGVWRYVFDQEGPSRGIPHHAADLMYLFDTVPRPACAQLTSFDQYSQETWCDGPFDDSDSDESVVELGTDRYNEPEWETAVVDDFSYARVRDAIQSKWISFAHGESPWREDKVFVFGPEGETGERSTTIFEGRRRINLWKESLEPLGHNIVQKIGVELSRGPCGTP